LALFPTSPQTDADKSAALQQDALMREVDEAVRQDQFTDIAKKYGTQIALVVAIGLAGFGGWLWWTDHREATLETASEGLILAVDDMSAGKNDSAEQAFARVADDSEGGAKVIARLAQAGIATEGGRPDEAAKIYAEVAADSGAPQLYRDFALIRETLLRYDTMKPADVEARMKPLAVPGAAWFGSAGELLGHAYLDQGKDEQAGALFASIATDEKVPDSIRFRVRQVAGSMGVDAIDDVDETLGEVTNKEADRAAR